MQKPARSKGAKDNALTSCGLLHWSHNFENRYRGFCDVQFQKAELW